MAFLVGAILAIVAGLLGTVSGMERDRAFYSTIAIVVASYYCLFAVIGASTDVLVIETLIAAAFVVAAVFGFRTSLWVVVIALAAHGGLDSIHGRVVSNPGVPAWWPAFCGTYDVAAAGYLTWRLMTRRIQVVP